MDPDDMLEKALSELHVSYRAHVKDLAKCILDSVKDGEIKDREDLDTRVRETVDGDVWVIYTRNAQVVLLCSEHDGEGVDEGLIDPSEFRDGVPWSKLAYCAMEVDLREAMSRLEDEYGLDLDEDDLGIEEDEDEEPESDPSP
jgi:hypothetical protein